MSLRLGETAPDFHAETTEGPISFHHWLGKLVGRHVLAPEGFHAGVHDRARLRGQAEAGSSTNATPRSLD
jgi:hypothetical protein